jgi:predicted enzyme related to lactoylglutathione lyase
MTVRQMRLVVEAEDYEEALRFYRDVLGLREELAVAGPDGARVTILDAGRATLELANPAQKRFIDEVEVGRQVAPKFRVAFEVDGVDGVTRRLVDAGAELIADTVETPWRSRNARLAGPAGIQLTLFEELAPA